MTSAVRVGGELTVASTFAGWAVARVASADQFRRFDAPVASLLSFTPQVAVGAWAGALLLRDRRARAITAVAAGAMTTVLAARAVPRRQPAVSGPELRVLTANLLFGRAAAAPVVDLVRRTAADVFFVQELTEAALTRLCAAGLDELLPYSVNDLGTAGSRGNGIYARYPLSGRTATASAFGAGPVVTLGLPAGPARLVCVHLRAPKRPWDRRRRPAGPGWRDELTALPGPATSGDAPLIIAGDFNSTLDHALFRRLLGRGYADAASQSGIGLVPTWGPEPGGRRSLLTLDHVLADSRCAVTGASVYSLPGTDHRAVFAALRLPAGDAGLRPAMRRCSGSRPGEIP
ncbi:MAG TPA: endonuclease/exonuclease/phosphatase family protein [Streptosporangiaceae bacterium]|nr:endonuclease/exonuclease/phosphatase family protein [Streptosporangiaceae bacterium]